MPTQFISKVEKFHKTRLGLLVFGLVELILAYLFAFSALGSGSLIDWILAIILLVGFVQNFVKSLVLHKK